MLIDALQTPGNISARCRVRFTVPDSLGTAGHGDGYKGVRDDVL